MLVAPPWPRRSAPVERAAGLAFLVFVLLVYSYALEHGRWPPGHPWSGSTLSLLGLTALIGPSARRPGASKLARAAALGMPALALVTAALWFHAAWTAPPTNVGL